MTGLAVLHPHGLLWMISNGLMPFLDVFFYHVVPKTAPRTQGEATPVKSRAGFVWGLGDSAFIPLSPVQAVSLQTMEWFSSLLLFPSSGIAIKIPDFQDGFRIPLAWHSGCWALPLFGHTGRFPF